MDPNEGKEKQSVRLSPSTLKLDRFKFFFDLISGFYHRTFEHLANSFFFCHPLCSRPNFRKIAVAHLWSEFKGVNVKSRMLLIECYKYFNQVTKTGLL